MNKISTDNRLPLYYQLYDIITEKIHSGIYNENDKLPSERELCEKYDISRATVRRAMVELEKNDYIYKKQGKGVFISSANSIAATLSGLLPERANEINNVGIFLLKYTSG